MFFIIKKVSFLVGLTLCLIVNVYSQIVTSTKNGIWTDPSVWDGGQIPTLVNATEIVVNHDVSIPDGSTISIRNVILNGTISVGTGAVVDLIPDGLPEKWDLQIFGRLTLQDGAVLNGTSTLNTSFESGARYLHFQGPLGFIPYATWNRNSTFEIAGFKTQGYINIAHSDSWKQNFGHVIYNCAQQTTAFVDLNGYLRNIAGNLIVRSTNNQALRLSTTQNPVINIGEDFIIEGPSKVWFSTNPTNAIVTIQKDFRYRSTSAGISYLTTKGVITVNVNGEMEMNSPGRFHMASTSLDSTGARLTTLGLHGHFTVNAGTIVGPPLPGKGRINFVGSGIQTVTSPSSGGSFQGTLDYLVESGSTVDMRNSVISNSSGTLVVRGKLQLGSSDAGGSIQLTNGGNIQVQGQRTFEPGCTIEYNGLAEQWIGAGHPSAPDVHLICSNPAGVALLKEIVVNDITLTGKFVAQSFPVTVYRNVFIAPQIDCSIEEINLYGGQHQQVSASGTTFKNLMINKSGNSAALTSPLQISESIIIASTNTTLNSNGYLTLLSTSDDNVGTVSVGIIPTGSSIVGHVTVNRHMAGEGRIYRYISSPVQNSTVGSLKDDFPITGRFLDPSSGSSSPSFYLYDESIGGLQEGWLPYPTSGLASANPLIVGKGYAAYIRNGSSSTTWDVTGPLNQGTIDLPVSFTPNNEPSNGWNLVGNPYACAIQWDEAGGDKWSMENISSVIAIRDNGSAGGGTFMYWDTDNNYSGGQIASGQAFWVRSTAVNPKLTIREGVKAMDGATFFRKEGAVIPSFALELSRDALNDVAFFKIRSSSKPGIDDWDGIKLDNDNFDLSFIAADKNSLAIHATDKFPCDTIVQLGLKDLVQGTYKLRLITKFDFSRYQYTLLDKFLNAETPLSSGEAISLIVTTDPASYAFDRISLRLVEHMPKAQIEINGDFSVCTGSVAKLIAKDVDANVTYTLWDNEVSVTSMKTDDGGDIVFFVLADSLALGQRNLRLQVQSACHLLPEVANYSLTIDTIPQVWADSSTVCPGDSAKLEAFSNRSDAKFHWVPEIHSVDTLATHYLFETGPLFKPQVFYVTATTPSGCSSNQLPVKVDIKVIETAEISVAGDTILNSNYANNNSWYLNGKKIEDETGPFLTLKLPGVYVLHVDTLGCVSEDGFEYVILNTEATTSEIFVYPNPAGETLHICDDRNLVDMVEIFDLLGKPVMMFEQLQKNQAVNTIDIRDLSDGIYIGVLATSQGKRVVRFGKKGQ